MQWVHFRSEVQACYSGKRVDREAEGVAEVQCFSGMHQSSAPRQKQKNKEKTPL
jgi:hypothetical protein